VKGILGFLVLPSEITDFERRYLARVNRVALAFFAMHVPAFALIAWLNHTGPAMAVLLTAGVLVGPAIAYSAIKNPRLVSVVYGVTAMFMGGLLVHFGQGPVQIEMHFYFFALVAMCAVFANPMVIVAAAVTVALHHLVVWLVIPRSVFNYNAQWWVVAVHAAFVVLESVATCFIARSFFDNVIGLEKIVQARTLALDTKNRDMRLLLDNVQQGFLTIDNDGRLAQERSAAVDRWFGAPKPEASWFDHLAVVSPEFAQKTRLGWDEVVGGIMPIELTLDQMPHRLTLNGSTHYRFDYRPIGASEPHERYLAIVTDVTTDVEREHAELERREAMAVFERVLVDRSGFETFFDEGASVVDALVNHRSTDLSVVKRLIHTLKGNAALFGLTSVANMCHALEDFIAEEASLPPSSAYAELSTRWGRLATDIERLLGKHTHGVEIDEQSYAALEASVRAGEPLPALLRRIRGLKLEPTVKRLRHFEELAKQIYARLDKGEVTVEIEDHGVRLDARRWAGFWSNFIHAVRNALDHGLEPAEARMAAGKPAQATLALRTFEEKDRIVVEIADNGRGIDWKAVGERAATMGLTTKTPEDLKNALFVDGVSTAASVTDLSGRGVGMGALLAGTRALGGDLAVHSTPGQGTTLRFTFPASAGRTRDSIAPAPALN
jgi:two-component system, chemotaxis family, sensor kinase CheA